MGLEINNSALRQNNGSDILRAVTGRPTDATLGLSMSGMDSLLVSIEMELSNLPALLRRYIQEFSNTSYKEEYPWVDTLLEVGDVELIESLNNRLIDAIHRDDPKINLAVPRIIDWLNVSGFRTRTSPTSPIYRDLDINLFAPHGKTIREITIRSLQNKTVYCISRSSDQPIDHWSALNSINFEISDGNTVYVLSDANWYAIDSNFISQVNAYVQAVKKSSLHLPRYSDADEGSYNRRVANANPNFAMMDEKNIVFGGGRSKIEFCDIFTNEKKLIHVKRYSGSSTLSHLFSQGYVSAETFLMDSDFRAAVNEKLPDEFMLADTEEMPDAKSYQIVFAIITNSVTDFELPFFSKVTLRQVCRRLNALNYSVALDTVLIGTEDIAD